MRTEIVTLRDDPGWQEKERRNAAADKRLDEVRTALRSVERELEAELERLADGFVAGQPVPVGRVAELEARKRVLERAVQMAESEKRMAEVHMRGGPPQGIRRVPEPGDPPMDPAEYFGAGGH